MHKSQLRNTRNMKNKENMTLPKVHNSLITKPEILKWLKDHTKFESLILK
jgi:hypothetical protein